MRPNHSENIDIKKEVHIHPNIGLDNDIRCAVVGLLNIILADEAILSMKTRGTLWNVRGTNILDQHTLFDVQFKQLNDVSDKISKRARELGGLPISSFEQFLLNTRLVEKPGVAADIMDLLADHESAIRFLREDAKKCTDEYEDEVTHDFLVVILRLHEKMAWMLRACIEPEMAHEEVPVKKLQPVKG
jgi:starvation-inducible DNA-binding protein